MPRRSKEGDSADLARAAIRRLGPLRAVVKSRSAQRLIHAWRGARAVRERARFAALELAGRRVAGYELAAAGTRIRLRHGTRDVQILNETFGGTGGSNSY
jgi:hypothetical protein